MKAINNESKGKFIKKLYLESFVHNFIQFEISKVPIKRKFIFKSLVFNVFKYLNTR
jgi:hypothetical protein